jgi:hypothetical protein
VTVVLVGVARKLAAMACCCAAARFGRLVFPGADMGIAEGNGGRFRSKGGGGRERPSPAVGELELFRTKELNDGEKALRVVGNMEPGGIPCENADELGGPEVIPYGDTLGAGACQNPAGGYGGTPALELPEPPLFILDDIELSPSPDRLDGGVRRFPTLADDGCVALRAAYTGYFDMLGSSGGGS